MEWVCLSYSTNAKQGKANCGLGNVPRRLENEFKYLLVPINQIRSNVAKGIARSLLHKTNVKPALTALLWKVKLYQHFFGPCREKL